MTQENEGRAALWNLMPQVWNSWRDTCDFTESFHQDASQLQARGTTAPSCTLVSLDLCRLIWAGTLHEITGFTELLEAKASLWFTPVS